MKANSKRRALAAVFAAFAVSWMGMADGVFADVRLNAVQGKTIRVDGAEPGEWTQDWEAAAAAAKETGMPVFANFTGSDWCPWCKILERQVFSQPEWIEWTRRNVYLVHLDFPNDKTLVPEKYRDRNRELARRYKVGGYPTCFLLDPATLEPIGRFGASRDANAAGFIGQVSAAMPAAEKAAEVNAAPVEDGGESLGAGPALPIDKFPVHGVVAGFTFNGEDKVDDFVKKGRKFMVGGVPPRGKEFRSAEHLVVNGTLQVPGKYAGDSLPHLDVPELRYDRFTVAMNFRPQADPGHSTPLVSFGGGWRWFHILLRADGTPVVSFRGLADGDLSYPLPEQYLPDKWNWIAVAFDAAERRLSVVLNGRRIPDIPLPPGFAFRLDRGDRERCRTVQFANPNSGTVYKGKIAGFLLFDRAFTDGELEAIATVRGAPSASAVPPGPSTSLAPGPSVVPDVAPDRWTFRPDGEGAALYWNGTVSDGTVTLDARLADDGVSIAFPDVLSVPGGVLDFRKPFVAADGAEFPLVGIGMGGNEAHVGFAGRRRDATEVRLPGTLRHVGRGAFEGFGSLARLECPDSVRSVGSAAFDGCRSLRRFRLGPAVETFSPDRVFMGCGALEAIETDPANLHYKSEDGVLYTADGKRLVAFPPGRKGVFAIPPGTEEIPSRAFLGCQGLTTVEVPASVKTIGAYAFANCPALERIEFGDPSFKLDESVFGTKDTPNYRRPETNLAGQ